MILQFRRKLLGIHHWIVRGYEDAILMQKIRLRDVPKKLRFDVSCTRAIHVCAFRIDRCTTRADYEEDLNFVLEEIAEAKQFGNDALDAALRFVYDKAKSELEYCPEIMRWRE
ncbi:MAG: hypothetical protein J6J18_06480 [Oscillospiraceae bacterium]|nr:hypothetical protein [Oscillospiraceae bacterium]